MSFQPTAPDRAAVGSPSQDFAASVLNVSAAALQRYEEPVFRALRDGTLEAANPLAQTFMARLAPEDLEKLAAAARKSNGHDRAVVDMVDVGGGVDIQHLQVTLVPLAAGVGVLLFIRDLTLDNSLRTALVESRRRYKDFIDISTDFPWETNRNRSFVFVPPRGALGYTPDALIASDPSSLVVGDGILANDQPFLTTRRIENEEFWLKRADGRPACVMVSAMPLLDSRGVWAGARGVCRDVTEIRDRENTLSRVRNRERVLTRIVRAFRDEVDPEAMLTVAADALARGLGAEHCHLFRVAPQGTAAGPIAGYLLSARFGDMDPSAAATVLDSIAKGAGAAEMLFDPWQVLAAPARYQSDSNGAVVLWRRIDRGPWNDDDRLLIGDIANQIGITIEQLIHHEHVLRISRTDALTGLLNRGAFIDGLQRFLARQHRASPESIASVLLYVDLDNFKHVNDSRGHQAGDDLLMKVRDILLQQTRPTDMVARLGGDEFAIWLNGADISIAKGRATKLLELCKTLAPYSGSADRPVGMSIGIAVWAPGAETLEGLLARADAAMYEAKRAGKGNFSIAPAGATS
ncbi:MAG: diguanylate cyclase [Rhodospirillaceae bacterium]|nr:MAG: diguanylate cyclase [Rhodospirillaceae bacterium]